MKVSHKSVLRFLAAAAFGILSAESSYAQNVPIAVRVDATEAPRKILHARLVIPTVPGKLTLLYPKWIPGEHGPSGPITDLTGLKLTALGQPLNWQRDPADMYAFNLEVPVGANAIEGALDFLLPATVEGFSSGASASPHLVVINWNQLVLYPKGPTARELKYAPSVRLPGGWKYGTALAVAKESNEGVEFTSVSLETLVDSPLIAGSNFRTVDLTPGATPSHQIHIAADSSSALEMRPEDLSHYSKLVAEINALFGARHYRSYHFLLSLSENVAHFGLEHHESSDNRAPERMLIDHDVHQLWATLLPHEMTHSWNGKYRRPSDLATADFHQPMKSELLWVYEGLTEYLGALLATRSGLWTNETYRESLAIEAARLEHQAGRGWRPLADTAIAAQLLYFAAPGGTAWRRSVDFYPEGWLIWMEADTTIRKQTQGRSSLDDFCRKFYGGQSGAPSVVTYNLDDVVSALAEIAPYDWREFFKTRVTSVNAHAPMAGIEASGWRLIYNDVVPGLLKAAEADKKSIDFTFSIGVQFKDDGTILDVIPGLAAYKAGLGPGMKLVGVNGRRWSKEILRDAIKETKTRSAPLELLVESGEFLKSYKIEYHDGERYPHLERDPAKTDLLEQILRPLTN